MGIGRNAVRFINASLWISYIWLHVLAAAEQAKVPTHVQHNFATSIVSPLPSTNPPAAVDMTIKESLPLDSLYRSRRT